MESNILPEKPLRSILTRQYKYQRTIGSPIPQIKILESNKIDELMVLHKTIETLSTKFVDLVQEICSFLSTPITVGGGINQKSDADRLFGIGIDRIILGRNKDNLLLTSHISNKYGSQSLIYSLDINFCDLNDENNSKISFELNQASNLGYGEVCVNIKSYDGALCGINLEILKFILTQTSLPVTIGCGVNSISNISEAFELGANGVCLSTFLAEKDQSPRQIKAHLISMGTRTRN